MTDDEFWRLEQDLWLGGEDAYRRRLHPDCVMAFPPPAGLMHGAASIVDSIRQAPRWSAVEMSGQILIRPADAVAVLACSAAARRDGQADAYSALCTSVYVRDAAGWRMIQHQQTPC